jgi:DNA-binding CsgD family transcriptional regulator
MQTPSLTPEKLSHIIGQVYDCVIDPERWPAVMDVIRQEHDFANAAFSVHDVGDPQRPAILHALINIDEEMQRRGRELNDATLALWGGPTRVQYFPLEEPIIQSQATSRCQWMDNAWYREILHPRRLHDAVTIGLQRSPHAVAALTLGRHEDSGAIEEREMTSLRLIAPHIRRAVLISKYLDRESAAADTFAGALDGLAAGVILVDVNLGVVHANRSARKVLDGPSPVRISSGMLSVGNATTQGVLAEAVVHAAHNEAAITRRSISIPSRREDGTPLVLQVLPLRQGTLRAGLSRNAVAAVFIADASEPPRHPADALAILYDMTPAEARVFELVISGKTPAELAFDLGIALPTARTHLSRVFEKTGCARQSDLVGLAAKLTLPV